MKPQLETFFTTLWHDYLLLNPEADQIAQALTHQKKENIINDHIALRTLNFTSINLEVLAGFFKKLGYEEKGTYEFPEKKLLAKHFEHQNYPKIFISELQTEAFSLPFQSLLKNIGQQIPLNFFDQKNPFIHEPLWKRSYQDYLLLEKESDYAAWFYVFGFRVNHFTVSFNHLKNFESLRELNTFIKDLGIKMNTVGSEIKGGPDVYLEQSSTLANKVRVAFEEGEYTIPSCYYEFARRYVKSDGKIYSGFIANSADKIFESTNRTK